MHREVWTLVFWYRGDEVHSTFATSERDALITADEHFECNIYEMVTIERIY